MMLWTKKWLVAFVIFVITFLAGCGGNSSAGGASQSPTNIAPVKANLKTTAQGQIIPLQSSKLSFNTSGVVSEIMAREGQAVATGQVIARLGGTERQAAAIKAAEMELLNAQQASKDLVDNAELDKAQAQLTLAQAEKKLDDARKRRASKDFTWGDRSQIDVAYANYILAQKSVDDLEAAFTFVSDLPDKDVTRAGALSSLANARQVRDRALANYNFLASRPNTIELAQVDGSYAVAQAEVEKAKKAYDLVKDGPDPDKMNLAKARIENAKAQLASANAALADLELHAPFAGVIVSNDLNVGEQTGPAISPVTLADISQWRIKTTDLTEKDVVHIHEGDSVKVTIDAIPELELPGKVERIKALGENKQGDITYTVTILLDQQDDRMRWNMTCFVTFNP